MGLKFDGREHSGLADAKNTAKLLAKMIKDGCVLGLTKGLKDTKIDSKIAFDDNQLNLVRILLFTYIFKNLKKSIINLIYEIISLIHLDKHLDGA